jgi:glutaredoxin
LFGALEVPKPAVLFVKSEKIDRVEYTVPNFGHYCSAGYRAFTTDSSLCEEDKKAFEILEKLGIDYKVVDLGSADMLTRVKALMIGVRKTPILILNGKRFGLREMMSKLEPSGVSQKQGVRPEIKSEKA